MMYDSIILRDIVELQKATNANFATCTGAIQYAIDNKGGYNLAVAYVKASQVMVSNNTMSFDERVKRIYQGSW